MIPILPLFLAAGLVQQLEEVSAPPPRIHVLFLGDRGHHLPDQRLASVWGALAREGVAVEWEEELAGVTAERLADFDCLMVYANQPGHSKAPREFMDAVLGFVRSGGGLVALHCASGCFPETDAWLELVGARFLSHGAEIFSQQVVLPGHPIMAGWEAFESWDETYVQQHNEAGRTVLAFRGEEPWTWVRAEGKGRVFYTASGHDDRTWSQPGFLDLLLRAVDWTVGEPIASRRSAFPLPALPGTREDMVPNYEGLEERPLFQRPSTPMEARDRLQPPAGFTVKLFAAEPMVVNPIAMTWDERGRLWVLESPDYPNEVHESGEGNDRVTILEDTDGDGLADSRTVFADRLNLPTGLLKVEGGVWVTQAPNLIFLRDEDGDDRADSREVLLSGFGRFDTHAGPSNLEWGPDNSLWGAIGYSSFRREDGSSFGSGLWRWSPGEEPVFLAQFTNNTWGLGLRSDGEIFGSTANGEPSFFMGVPMDLVKKTNSGFPGAAPVLDQKSIHPALSDIRQGDYLGGWTAAAGHAFSTGPDLPPEWGERMAFVCEPTGHLVGRLEAYSAGSGYRTRDAFNLVASTDEWFCPVQAGVGPDGAVWIADFAQFIILHNLPGNPERGLPRIEYGDGSAHLNPNRDKSHGRIWRVEKRGPHLSPPGLADAGPSELVAALGNPNRFWRVQARRILVQGRIGTAIPGLYGSVRRGGALTAAAAVRALAGLNALGDKKGMEVLEAAFARHESEVLKAVLQSLPSTPGSARILAASGVFDHVDPSIRRQAFLAASRMPASDALGIILAGRAVLEDAEDPWIPAALGAAVGSHAKAFLAAATPLLPTPEEAPRREEMVNSGFDHPSAEDPDRPDGWRVRVYSGEAEHVWLKEGGRDGGPCLAIRSEKGADTSWCVDLPTRPNTRYRLAGWIRTFGVTAEGGTHGALLNVHPRPWTTESLKGDEGWTRVEVEFSTGPEERSVSLNCLYGGWGRSTGEARYDDLSLVALGPAHSMADWLELARASSGESLGVSLPRSRDASFSPDGGDSERGREVFLGNASTACYRCHTLDGAGGSLGPDLSEVGARLSREGLLESILDPTAALAESWKAPISAMPALGAFLSDNEIRDLVAFLEALDGNLANHSPEELPFEPPPFLPFLLVGILVLLLVLRLVKD